MVHRPLPRFSERLTAVRNDTGSPPALQDGHGRVMRKLRVSITEACNYRCTYCMPADARFPPANRYLQAEEYPALIEPLARLGIRKVRVTGGEPLLRPGFRNIMRALASVDGITLALTTNGHLLARQLPFLREVGLRSINVSVDSLSPERFACITRGGDLERVLHALRAARDMGFQVKVNTVMAKRVNEDELLAFHDFSATEGIEVRFLEMMRIGLMSAEGGSSLLSAANMLEVLSDWVTLSPLEVERDSTSFVYESERGARLGFIASESRPFCGDCSRLRLSPTGVLRACLMKTDGLSIRNLDSPAIEAAAAEVIQWKPIERVAFIDQPMYQIGG